MKTTYEQQTWHFLVRKLEMGKWQVVKQTDNETEAVRTALEYNDTLAHVLNVWNDTVIFQTR